jgi:chromosome partitioning protein
MKTLTICHSKGGVGKSTLSWNLAISLSSIYSVLLIDLDIQTTITHTNTAREANARKPMDIARPTSIHELSVLCSSSQYDFVLIDVGGYDFDLGRAAIALADRIIVPISDNPTELFGFITFTQFLGEIQQSTPIPPLLAVINAVHPRASHFESIHGVVNLWPSARIAHTVVRRRMVYAASMGIGFGVTEMSAKYPQAAFEIGQLAGEVM